MRGVKYDVSISLPREESILIKNLNMKSLIQKVDKIILEHYFLNPKMNNQKVYNLMYREKFVNTFLKNRVKVNKIDKIISA